MEIIIFTVQKYHDQRNVTNYRKRFCAYIYYIYIYNSIYFVEWFTNQNFCISYIYLWLVWIVLFKSHWKSIKEHLNWKQNIKSWNITPWSTKSLCNVGLEILLFVTRKAGAISVEIRTTFLFRWCVSGLNEFYCEFNKNTVPCMMNCYQLLFKNFLLK